MTRSATTKSYLRSVAMLLLTAIMCTSLSGCLLAAAGAGAAGGYMIGREAEEDRHEHHHVDHVD